MKVNFLKKYWHMLFYFIVVVVLFQGFIFSDEVLFSSDQLESGVFFRKMYADFVRTFWEMPLWDRYISGGLPFVDAMHGDTFYPAAILKFFMPIHRALGYKLVLHVFLAGVFMFTFLKNYGLNKLSSFLGGLAYMLAPMLVSLVYPGHDAKMYVAALLPLAFNFLYKGLRDNLFRNYVYLGIVIGFMILSSHVQTTYFAMWAIFFYEVFYLITDYVKNKDFKKSSASFGKFWFAVFFGVLIGAVQLIPPYVYSKQFSIRGTEAKTSFEHACSWGIHPEEVVSLVVPEFSGENRLGHVRTRDEYDKVLSEGGNSYWGRNAFKLNSEYSGVVVLIISLLALLFYRGKKRKDVYFFTGLGVFVVLYSLVNHTPLFYLVYKIIPGVKLFRGQGMILFELTFVLSVLSAIFFDKFRNGEEEKNKISGMITSKDKGTVSKRDDFDLISLSKKLLIVLGIVTGIVIISIVFFDAKMSLYETIFNPPKMPGAEYLGIIKKGMVYSGILCIGTISVFYLLSKKSISLLTAATILSALILFDTARIDKKFVKTLEPKSIGFKFKEDKLIEGIKAQYKKGEIFRVFNHPYAEYYSKNEIPVHGIETVRGFHDNELKWYRKFRGINSAGVNTDRNLVENIEKGHENNFLNIAGAKYLVYKNKDGSPAVIPNKNYMPRSFVVSKYEIIEDEDKIVERMKQKDFDYKNTIILEKDPEVILEEGEGAPGIVKNYGYRGNELFVEADMNRDGFLFMSDTYFPYWHAYDEATGEELEIMKADLTFRAIYLKKGSHKIRLEYVSVPYIIGKYLTLLGLLFGFGTVVVNLRKKMKSKEQ
jgi:hypothetical protein